MIEHAEERSQALSKGLEDGDADAADLLVSAELTGAANSAVARECGSLGVVIRTDSGSRLSD